MLKNSHKYLDFTEEEIDEYLRKFRSLVSRNKYNIADKNREKNVDFIKKYNLNSFLEGDENDY